MTVSRRTATEAPAGPRPSGQRPQTGGHQRRPGPLIQSAAREQAAWARLAEVEVPAAEAAGMKAQHKQEQAERNVA
ncbi:hypothetical protein ACFZC7_35625 [Streptomyces massasporeus]|uniref:hypothetical protein n=1 Tax=Streptomyces massasporeus TaxID=67324 RepID=UPI0036E5E9D6